MDKKPEFNEAVLIEKERMDNVTIAMFVIGGIAVVGALVGWVVDADPLAFLGTCVTAVGSLAGGISRTLK